VGHSPRLSRPKDIPTPLLVTSNRHTPPELEMTVTYTKQTVGPRSNRHRYALFLSSNRIRFLRSRHGGQASGQGGGQPKATASRRDPPAETAGVQTTDFDSAENAPLRMTRKRQSGVEPPHSKKATADPCLRQAGLAMNRFGMTTQRNSRSLTAIAHAHALGSLRHGTQGRRDDSERQKLAA
jgi:hypothetical protein